MELKRKITFHLISSVLPIIISMVALAISLHTTKPLGIDYLGLIVGVLAMLTTVLIGWQIFSIIDMDRRIKVVVYGLMLEYEKEAKNAVLTTFIASYYTSIAGYVHSREWFKVIAHNDSVIDILHQLGDKDQISIIVKNTYNLMDNIDQFGDREIEMLRQYIQKLKKLSVYSDEILDLYAYASKKLDL